MNVVCASDPKEVAASSCSATIVEASAPPMMVGASMPSALPGRIVEATPVGGVSTLVATPAPHARQRPAELAIRLPQREQTILLPAQKWSWSFALNWVESQIIVSFARAGG